MWVAEGVAPHGSEVYSWIVHGSVVQNYVVPSVLDSLVVLMQIAHSFVAQSDMAYAVHRVQSCSGQDPVALVQSPAVVALPEETLVLGRRVAGEEELQRVDIVAVFRGGGEGGPDLGRVTLALAGIYPSFCHKLLS